MSSPHTTPQMTGAQVEFAAGAVIFRQGDPGGDLYLLKSGEVEVFRTSGGVDVRLATLRQGEILGIMTCLTREPRLASARALTEVKALVVKQAGFKTLISSTPAWVHTVIKDFIVRIKNMDELYAKAMERLDKQDKDVGLLHVASAVAAGLGEVGAMLSSPGDTPRLVDIDQVLGKLARILDISDGRIKQVFNIFIETGLLRADPNASSRKAELPVLERLRGFTEFCRRYFDSKEHRACLEALTAKDCAALVALQESAKGPGQKLTETLKVPLDKLKVEDGDPRGLAARAAAARFAEFDAATEMLMFSPLQLLSGVRYLLVIQKTRALGRQKASVPKEAAAPDGAEKPLSVEVITENF